MNERGDLRNLYDRAALASVGPYRDFLEKFQRLQANLSPTAIGLHLAVDIWGREGARAGSCMIFGKSIPR